MSLHGGRHIPESALPLFDLPPDHSFAEALQRILALLGADDFFRDDVRSHLGAWRQVPDKVEYLFVRFFLLSTPCRSSSRIDPWLRSAHSAQEHVSETAIAVYIGWLRMITMTTTLAMRDELAVALVAYAADPRMAGALGRVKKVDHPLTCAALVRVWPSDADGRCRIALSDVAGTLAWRAMAIADIVAGRDISADLAGRLGVTVEAAFAYIDKYSASIGHRWPAYTEPSRGQCGRRWTGATERILAGRPIPVPEDGMDNMPRFDKNRRRMVYTSISRAGLMLPPTLDASGLFFRPRASSLFLTPVPDLVTVSFSAADEVAIAELRV